MCLTSRIRIISFQSGWTQLSQTTPEFQWLNTMKGSSFPVTILCRSVGLGEFHLRHQGRRCLPPGNPASSEGLESCPGSSAPAHRREVGENLENTQKVSEPGLQVMSGSPQFTDGPQSRGLLSAGAHESRHVVRRRKDTQPSLLQRYILIPLWWPIPS